LSNNQSAIHAFSSRMSAAPTPQPGKYTVVFATGAGEPKKSAEFQPDPKTIKATVGNFPEMYAAAPRYVEMRCLLNLSDFDFARFLQGNTLVAIDQQIVHPHEAWNGLR
jgi:hypothetical protein